MASVAAALQRSGGSEGASAAVLNDRLDALAASIEAAATPMATTVSFECLAADAEEVLGLTADLVQ